MSLFGANPSKSDTKLISPTKSSKAPGALEEGKSQGQGGSDSGGSTQSFRFIEILDDLAMGKNNFFRFVRKVGDIMTPNPFAITLDTSVEELMDFFRKKRVRHAPVVDPKAGQKETSGVTQLSDPSKYDFVGLVSDRDLCRQITENTATMIESAQESKIRKKKVSSFVTRNPVTVRPGDDLIATVAKMEEMKFDAVPVLDDQKNLIGIMTSEDVLKIFTRLDFVNRLTSGFNSSKVQRSGKFRMIDAFKSQMASPESFFFENISKVEDLMTTDPVTLSPMSRLGEAITLMKSSQIRHVPIVNEQGQIEGLLGDREILMVLPEPKPRLEVHRELPEAFRERLFEVDKEDLVLTKMVKDVMNRKPQIVRCSSKIVDAAKTMIENKASCLLAATEDGRLAGVLTTGDYMKAIGVFGQFLKD